MSSATTAQPKTFKATCRTCHTTGEIAAHRRDEWTGECPACMRDRADVADRARLRNFEGPTIEVDPLELMRTADDGAPAADVIDSWLDSDFPNQTNTTTNTAATDVAPAETRDGSHVADAGSRQGSRDAAEPPRGAGASNACDASVPFFGVGGDLSALPTRSLDVDSPVHQRGRVFSDNLVAPGAGDWLRLWRGVGRIAC